MFGILLVCIANVECSECFDQPIIYTGSSKKMALVLICNSSSYNEDSEVFILKDR